MEVTGYSPEDLLDTARELLARPDAKAKGIWPRAAAHLCRQALEASLDQFWSQRLPDMENVHSMRAQLICLPTYFEPDALAREIAYAWSALSAACHHCTYELAPTAAELTQWIDTVASLQAVVAKDAG